jgi:DNA-binding LacI/PurR family transcriptional regulator/signal transduction histidine kinase
MGPGAACVSGEVRCPRPGAIWMANLMSADTHTRSTGSKRPTLGVLVDWLEDVYQNSVLSGIRATARSANVNLICFAGGVLRSPDAFGARRNGVYELANADTVDGLVILSGTIGNHVGPDELARYCERYRGLPLASIGIALPGVPSFGVDNARGMAEAIGHLIEVHRYRDIAFVRGPQANAEAERRFEVYRQVLAEHRIPFDPQLVTPGNFQAQAGADAIRVLVDERRRRFDAVVAANDHMAIGAIGALRARSIRIPTDVAVVGFDDVEDARFATVPLATVRQPLWEQGSLAAQSVIQRWRGGSSVGGKVLPAEFVPRRSCGCEEPGSDDLLTASQRIPTLGERITGLWELLSADAASKEDDHFLAELEARIAKTAERGENVQSWHAVLSLLRSAAIGRLKKTAAQRAAALIDEARIRVSVLAEQSEAQARLQAEHWVRTLRRAGEVIITTFDAQSLAVALVSQLPKLGIDCCYLSIFDEPLELSASVSAQTARLLLAYDAASGQPPLIDARRYPAHELVPRALLPTEQPFTLVVEPLFFDELQLGFVTIGMGPRSGVVYEALRSQLATALKGGFLAAQVLKESQRRQIEERDTRQAQKLESVGRLAAGIAHEINTPVQFVSDSMHFIDEAFGDLAVLIGRYRAHREALASEPQWQQEALALGQAENDADLVYLLENGPPAIERSLDGLARVTAIVRSMKEFAHPDQGRQAPADVNKAIENTLIIARNEYKYVADVKVELGNLPPVVCNLGELNQVLLNLLVNAAHAIDDIVRGTGDKGLITVKTWQDGDAAVIAISDTGGGIPENVRERIFDPFFTTKEVGRGTGQGLAIARAAIVGKHGGTLTFETDLGRGTTFFVRLPAPQVVSSSQGELEVAFGLTASEPAPRGD